MSTILCILDGMTDPAFRAGDYACLRAGRLLRHIQTTPPGQEPESLTCILTLLGIRSIPAGLRGYAEALGAGIPVQPDDLILRGSWMRLDPEGNCTVPAEAPESLNYPGVQYYRLGEYKSLFLLPGCAAHLASVHTHPPYRSAGKPVLAFRPSGLPLLEDLFDRCLSGERCMIPWGASVPAALPAFPLRSAAVCAAHVVRGIASLLGMHPVPLHRATCDTDTDLAEKTQAALQAAATYPFVLLHINGADEAAHRRDAEEKRSFLRAIDRTVLPALLESPHTVYLACDHGSDPETGRHLADPQPIYLLAKEKP